MSDEPIETYLDDLMQASRALPAGQARYRIAEAETHLRDATETAVAAGVEPDQAQRNALAAFGSVDDLVAQELTRLRMPIRVLAARVARSASWLALLGTIAVGISGIVAAAIYLVGGAKAVATAPTAADLTAGSCARWLSLWIGDCRAAAIPDWAWEISRQHRRRRQARGTARITRRRSRSRRKSRRHQGIGNGLRV